MEMIALLRDLVQLLTRDELTVEDVVSAVGSIVEDPGMPGSMTLRSPVPGVTGTSLSRYPDTGLPFVLTLAFEPNAQPTLANLVAAFGAHRRIYSDRGMPVSLFFEPAVRGSAWTVALFAELPPGTRAFDTARVERVALQRDPALIAPGADAGGRQVGP